MRSCDTCPGGSECAADNLAPVLAEIYSLYTSGTTNKFDILFSLSSQSEELFDRYINQASRICWTKATLEIIANVLATSNYPIENKEAVQNVVHQILSSAVAAFANFPWYVSGLIGQAPDLYDAVCYLDQKNIFSSYLSKRQFMKLCKDVVYME